MGCDGIRTDTLLYVLSGAGTWRMLLKFHPWFEFGGGASGFLETDWTGGEVTAAAGQ